MFPQSDLRTFAATQNMNFREKVQMITTYIDLHTISDLSNSVVENKSFTIQVKLPEPVHTTGQSLLFLDSFYVSTYRYDTVDLMEQPSHILIELNDIKVRNSCNIDSLDNKIIIQNENVARPYLNLSGHIVERPLLLKFPYKSKFIGYLNPLRRDTFNLIISDIDGNSIFSYSGHGEPLFHHKKLMIQFLLCEVEGSVTSHY